MTRVAVPAIVTLTLVAALLATSGWNRSGEPLQRITLTERELWLEAPPPSPTGDDPGFRLRLTFDPRAEPLDARAWLTDDRLRSLGFGLAVPMGAPEAAHIYDRVPPRVGWVVLEYDGNAYRDIERRRPLQQDHVWRAGLEPSRLVPIDAGPDGESLRARYGAGHLTLRAIFALRYDAARAGGPLLSGWVRETVPTSISVPRHLRELFDTLTADGAPDHRDPARPPRYEVDLAVGRLGLPFVTAVRRLTTAAVSR